jgi:hypothetical protein
VPAISNKIADIPPDEYSWRKYGQKPIKGSPHPRYELDKKYLAGATSIEMSIKSFSVMMIDPLFSMLYHEKWHICIRLSGCPFICM